MTKNVFLFLVSLWWGWTVLIDFVVVPTVFKIINDFFNAGELGIALFSKLNLFEIAVASLLIALMAFNKAMFRRGKLQLGLLIAVWTIVNIYLYYLTPKLTHLTELWKQAEVLNTVGIGGVADVQQEHQYFHRIYVAFDTVKLLILSGLLGLNAKA